MINLGLTRAEYDAYVATLRDSHRIRVELRIHNRDEKVIGSLTQPLNQVVSGAVQGDTTSDGPTRTLDVTVLDPDRKLRFEADSPAHGALYADRFISAHYEVYVPTLGWVSCPVFWGPLTGFERQGFEINLTATGKESLLMAPHYATHGYTLKQGTRLDSAIRRVAAKGGEGRFHLPDLPHRLAQDHAVTAQAEPWAILDGGRVVEGFFTPKRVRRGSKKHTRMASDPTGRSAPGLVQSAKGNRVPGFDANGRLGARKVDRPVCFTFAEGRDLVSRPTLTYDTTDFRNRVVVLGHKPDGKPRATGVAILPAHHPLSPQALSRNGEPRYLSDPPIEADGLKTDADCRERAQEVLDHASRSGVDVQFDCLPIPFLEEHDALRLRTSEYSLPFDLSQWTLPLTSDQAMSVGFRRPVHKWRRRRRYHR